MHGNWHTRRIKDPQYPALGEIIEQVLHIHPCRTFKRMKRVVDLGSSVGAIHRNMKIPIKVGVDGAQEAMDNYVGGGAFVKWDLNKPGLDKIITEKVDVIICFEVAEHLEYPLELIKTIGKLATKKTTLFFSAAHPEQKGAGHINPRWHKVWLDNLEIFTPFRLNVLSTNYFHYLVGMWNANDCHYNDQIAECYLNTMVLQVSSGWDSKDCFEHSHKIKLEMR